MNKECNIFYITSSKSYSINFKRNTLSEIILSVDKLSKHYGRIKAVNELSLDISKGTVFGILGPNGSGKTTLLGLVLDVINPTSGEFRWFGDLPNTEARKKVGAILETPNFYPYLSAVKNLEIIAEIKGASYDEIPKVLEIVELSERQKSKFKTFSLGMKQRLAIAAALLGTPEVLILDEPTNGLDPQGIAEIRNIILEIAKKGITIILASHLLDEVQKTCTDVVVLKKGEKLFSGKVDEVLNDSVVIEIGGPDLEAISTCLKAYDKIDSIEKENALLLVKLKEGVTSAEINNYLFNKKIEVSHLSNRKKSLEKYFLELLEEKHDQTS